MDILYNLNEIDETIKAIAPNLHKGVILLKGEMGSGKTTFIRHLLNYFGVKDTISSPTFSIINEYKLGDDKIYHFDFYRIQDESEAYEIGTEESLNSGYFCFIEWPQRIPSLIPKKHQIISLSITRENIFERTLTLSTYR